MAKSAAPNANKSILTHRVVVPLDGFTAGEGGSIVIDNAVSQLAGVKHVYVNPAMEMAYIEYEPCLCTIQELIEAIEQAGFKTGTPILR